jgi:hypothetical protein
MTPRKFLMLGCLFFCLFAFLLQDVAQLPPVNTNIGPKPPVGTGACSVEKSCEDIAPDIIRSALGVSPLEANLRRLTDEIGGRLTGSPAADKAVGWGVESFRVAGVDEVHTEKFTVPVGWSEGKTSLEILFPVPFPVRLVSIGWSPPTPADGITAGIVDVGKGDEAGFAKAGDAAKGAIVLAHSELLTTLEQLLDEYFQGPGIVDRAVKSGAVAILWMSTRPNLLLYRHSLTTDGRLAPLPQAIVAREDAERIARFLAVNQKVRVHFVMPNQVTEPVESENVVAEIRGREKPDEFVLLGAHLDSWELGTGALDDGCNAAMVIDAARVIRSSGVRPRRSIRFVLFTGEEQDMLGSWAFAKAHRDELDRMIAAVIFDEGTGKVTGYSLGGRRDIEAALRDALKPAESLGANENTPDAFVGTDNFDFLLEGVPTLVANQEPANYMLNYHAASDTFDKVDMNELKRQVALAALTAFGIADRADRLGPRQTRSEVEALVKETGLDQQMKTMAIWTTWESGIRGRQQ